MKRVLVLFALTFILTVLSSSKTGAVTLEPVRITVTSSAPNITTGATLIIDLLNSNGSALDGTTLPIVREGVTTNSAGVLSFVLDEPAWSAPEYNPNYLVRITYDGVVLSIERLEVVYAKQGLFGVHIDSDEMDPEETTLATNSAVDKLTPGNTINGVNFDGSAPITIPSDANTITGIVATNHGGTGISSYIKGDIIYASDVTTLSNLNDAAVGNALISGGEGTAPLWGKIDLTSHTEGILPIAKGGTGQNTYTDGQLLIGNTDGNTLTKAELTAGPGITITNGNGSITIGTVPVYIPPNFNIKSTIITLTSTSAFTVPAGVYTITIEAVGGGGGGGGSGADMNSGASGATGGGGGGGAGEYVGMILNVKPGDVIGVTIGSAGTAGAAGLISGLGNGGNGGAGGNTVIKLNPNTDNITLLTANGGMGGAGSPGNSTANSSPGGNGGIGGTGCTEHLHKNGIAGSNGTASSSYGNSAGSGGGAGATPYPTGTNSNKGGIGGAGVYIENSKLAGNPGSAGAAGCVVISYY